MRVLLSLVLTVIAIPSFAVVVAEPISKPVDAGKSSVPVQSGKPAGGKLKVQAVVVPQTDGTLHRMMKRQREKIAAGQALP